MKSYELKPTHENLMDTLIRNTLDRNKDIFMFADILNSLEDSCSIAIDGSWGSGKTFFVHQVKMFLDANNSFLTSMEEDDKSSIISLWKQAHSKDAELDYQAQVSVYYDAWENDNDEDPMLSLVHAILKNVDADFTLDNNKDCIEIASTILEFFTGKDWNALIDSFRSEDPLAELRKSKAIEEKIKEFLDSLLEERGNRLVVFIDELDRCKPSYAVRLLERIKHYFANDRITFVFSVNTYELQHTIKRYYGDEFDACRYLDRFFDLRVSIPPANMDAFYRSINFDNRRYFYDVVCHAVIKKYKFSLREITRYIKLAKIAAYEPTHENGRDYNFIFSEGKAIEFCLLYIVPIMLGLKIANSHMYDDFISGKDPSALFEFKDCVNESIFWNLLNKDETYDTEDQSKTIFLVNDKLKEVYNALFNTDYSGAIYNKKIGNYTFEKRTQDILMRTVSLLSHYASFDID